MKAWLLGASAVFLLPCIQPGQQVSFREASTALHLTNTCSTTCRPQSSNHILDTVKCVPTCIAVVCHTQLTAHVRQVHKPQSLFRCSASCMNKSGTMKAGHCINFTPWDMASLDNNSHRFYGQNCGYVKTGSPFKIAANVIYR